MRTYRTRRSGLRMFGYLVATLLVVSGLVLVGYSFLNSVFESTIINPDAYHITRPISGKSVITLQTCTLPDYSDRLIIQAELTAVG